MDNSFDEHFLLVGAWKGNINDIPGFDEVKTNQLMDETIVIKIFYNIHTRQISTYRIPVSPYDLTSEMQKL